MNGPPSLIDLFEVQPSSPEIVEQTENRLRQVTPEREKLDAELITARESHQTLRNTCGELTAGIAKDEAEFNLKYMSALVEINQNPGACDIQGIAESLRPWEHKLTLARDARDLLVHKLMPAAQLHTLEVLFRLRKVELEEVRLLAFISQERTLKKAAEVFGEEGRCAIVGERTQALVKQTAEAERQLALAEDELRQERKRQLTDEQQRFFCHQITRAEAVASIPACAALIS
jgi:hypothetical protein